MATLGEIYRGQKRLAEAESILVQGLSSGGGRRISGDLAPTVVSMMNSLSLLYFEQGKSDAAESLSVEVLGAGARELGEEHREIRKAVNNLASMYANQERYDEAAAMFERALETDRRTLGTDHPDVLSRMNNLAFVYKKQGNLEKAEPLYVQVVQIKERVLGEAHPDVLTSKNNLAALWIEQARFREAEPMITQVVRITRETFPNDKGRLGNALAWQGECLRGLARYDEAERALLEGVGLLSEAFGPSHARTARGVNFLVSLYEARGDAARAAAWRAKLAAPAQSTG
jgi:tetratricopeptide (TPR) repeat protein